MYHKWILTETLASVTLTCIMCALKIRKSYNKYMTWEGLINSAKATLI